MSNEEDWKELERWQKDDRIRKETNNVKVYDEKDYVKVKKFSEKLDKFLKRSFKFIIVVGIIMTAILFLYIYLLFAMAGM